MRAKELADKFGWSNATKLTVQNRWWPVVWDLNGGARLYVSRRRMNDKGRLLLCIDDPHHPIIVSRAEAIRYLNGVWHSYEHLGVIPTPSERQSYETRNPDEVEAWMKTIIAASIEKENVHKVAALRMETVSASPIQKWIFDSGSGIDLVDSSSVAHLTHEWESLESPRTLHTAGGLVACNNKVSMFLNVLGEVITPSLVPSTPPVLSLGRRCIRDGLDFWWPPYSLSPRIVTPEGKTIYLTVHGDIPYLEDTVDTFAMVSSTEIGVSSTRDYANC